MSGWREIPTGVYECDNSCLKILLCWYKLKCVLRTDDALSWSLYKSLFPWRVTLKCSSGVCYNSIMEEKRCCFASHSLLLCISRSPDVPVLSWFMWTPRTIVSSSDLAGGSADRGWTPGWQNSGRWLLVLQVSPAETPLVSQHWPIAPKLVLKAQNADGFSSDSRGHPGLQSAQEHVNTLTCISQSMRKRVRSSACSKYLWFNLLNDR